MTVLDRLERRIGWISFPGFLRFYAVFHLMVFLLHFIRPNISELLEFDRAKILSGEVWRLATFFFAGAGVGTPSLISVIFVACMVNFIFTMSDTLEGAWGVFKTSLFYYTGILFLLVANFIYPFNVPFSGTALYGSAFFAFATLVPRYELRLMLFIPVQIRFLAILQLGMLVLLVILNPILLPFALLAFANSIFWAGIPALRGKARVIEAGQRRKRFNSAKGAGGDAFHTCGVCQKTDLSNPHLEFRIGTDGEEYCSEHLPE